MSKSDTLLVGASGYIGSNCPFPCDKVDLRTGQDFLELKPSNYDTIIFLAANLDSTKKDYIANERLYEALDDWLRTYPDIHVIFASSAAVYGESLYASREKDLPEPINLYGKSKLSGEFRVREYKYHTVLRFANVYGRIKGNGGHGVTEAFQNGSVIIHGDGKQIRDFVPVSKIWEVIELARDNEEIWHGVFNVPVAKPVSINKWFEKHGRGQPQHVEEREGDIRVSILDNSKMLEAIAACQ